MALMGCGRLAACKTLAGKWSLLLCRPMRVTWGDILAHVGHRPTSAEIRVDVRARQARRKALKPLLSELFLPYNLPDVLLTKVLTWVGHDQIHRRGNYYIYQKDELLTNATAKLLLEYGEDEFEVPRPGIVYHIVWRTRLKVAFVRGSSSRTRSATATSPSS